MGNLARHILLVGLACTVFVTAACAAPVEISLFMWVGDPEAIGALLDEYSATTSNVKVVLEVSPGAEITKFEQVLVRTSAGAAPDFTMGSSDIGWYVGTGALEDLTPFIKKEPRALSAFPQPMIQAFNFSGQQLAVPAVVSGDPMVYNIHRFAEGGLEPPPADFKDASFTWRRFTDAARKLTRDSDGDGVPDRWGLASLPYFDKWLLWWDCFIMSDAATESTALSEAVGRALTDVQTLAQARVMGGNLQAGTAAMSSYGLWNLPAMLRFDIDWAFMANPRPTDKPVATFIPMGFAMCSGSKHKEDVWAFFRWISQPENNWKWVLATGRVPGAIANLNPWAQRYFTGQHANARPEVIMQTVVEGDSIHRSTMNGKWPNIYPNTDALLSQMMQGVRSVQETQILIDQLVRTELGRK